MTPDTAVHDRASGLGSVYTTDSLPVRRRRAYWREALSRTFGAVNMTVPDEVWSGTIRISPLGWLLAAVAYRSGFTSVVHFSRAFRSAYGMSPSEWREAQGGSFPSHIPCVPGQGASAVES
jgi:AraC-like DNA-binding protein